MATGLPMVGDSMVKEALRSLCRNNGWSYGVFWRLDQKSSLLTLQDLYFEEVEDLMVDMFQQVHVLGQGVVGQAASTDRHKWMFSDSHLGIDHFEFNRLFPAGMKTVIVIPVELCGVVQFGSTQKLEERLEFISQTKEIFQSIQIIQGLTSSSVDGLFCPNVDAWDANELAASLVSSQGFHFTTPEIQHGDARLLQDLMETDCSLANMTDPFLSTLEYPKLDPFVIAQGDRNGNESNVQSQLSDMLCGGLMELSASPFPRNSMWSDSTIQDSSNLYVDLANISKQFFRNSHGFDELHRPCGDHLERPSKLCTFEELSKFDSLDGLPRNAAVDDILQCFSSLADQNNAPMTATQASEPSGGGSMSEDRTNNIIIDNQPSTSAQSVVTNALSSTGKLESLEAFDTGKQFPCSGMAAGSNSAQCSDSIFLPVELGGHFDRKKSSDSDCCISGQSVDSKLRTTSDTLFSKLGLHQRLDEFSRGTHVAARSDPADWLSYSAKRRKMGSEVTCLPHYVGSLKGVEPVYHHLNSSKIFESKDRDIMSLEAVSCIADSCSIGATKTVSSPTKLEQPVKPIKKKAKPGTKPRPKDRQQIHDRLIELRELIPNGEKMSIDRLLHLTIKHLLFMQSVARYAEMLQQSSEETKREIHKNSGGITWACEVADQKMICPLIVEDLSVPGQMLIELDSCGCLSFSCCLSWKVTTNWYARAARTNAAYFATRDCKNLKGADDPRKVFHCLKVGIALSIVSLFYYMRPLYDGVGGTAMWAVMTVVVVFEYTVGATIQKCLNRVMGTCMAGLLAVGVHWLATKSGNTIEPIITGTSLFLLASAVTFSRFIPGVKKRFDYGLMIFILTFSLVSVSGFRVEKLIDLARQRLSTIIIGTSLCILTSMLVFPVWAGQDLHCLITRNMKKLADSLDGCVAEFFGDESLEKTSDGSIPNPSAYKCVLNSKATEEAMANFARWEPSHGRFSFKHPWKHYLQIGASMRKCAYIIEALNSFVSNKNEGCAVMKKQVNDVCEKVSSSATKILREVSMNLEKMEKSTKLEISIQEMNNAVLELKNQLESLPNLVLSSSPDKSSKSDEGKQDETRSSGGTITMAVDISIPLVEMIPLVTFASLLIEIPSRVEAIVEAVDELAKMAEFKPPRKLVLKQEDTITNENKRDQIQRNAAAADDDDDDETMKTLQRV
ncbi:OLC1v1028875C1 [Oldenlandia corymbosa var. corymbosa]|uniref:OLC1v1028875C1 n=1 Tax=Oldenlandia corymbosa var. corymbosa TaxID=529605 RepID=A0AAV1CD59_OLDCO|nr:OLC1v1028875C1 [Oldenlandia corymbosa var. corymbosa]